MAVAFGKKPGDSFGASLVAVEELDNMFGGWYASDDAISDSHTPVPAFPEDTSRVLRRVDTSLANAVPPFHPYRLDKTRPGVLGCASMLLTSLALIVELSLGLAQGSHPKSYWQAIAKEKFELPAGEQAVPLGDELIGNLGSTDPELRDDLAFSILTSWIYQKKLLGPDDLRRMVLLLQSNLRRGIGERDGDGVLLRSFSALTLSVIAARENEAAFLSAAEYHQLVGAALAYLRDEQDLRGYDPQRGWIHSAAHTSDLLKFLARSPKLEPAEQAKILAALLAKNTGALASFTHGEDERMARVVISIVRRADLDRDGFRAWLASAGAAAKFPQTVTPDALRAQQNVRHLLAALWAELSVDERPSEGADFARTALRDTLKGAAF